MAHRAGVAPPILATLVTALCIGAAGTRPPVSPSPPPLPTATAIPWATATFPLPPTPVGAPVGVRPCHAAALTAANLGTSALTGGQVATGIGVGNRAAVACTLQGVPTVDLLDSQGRPLPGTQYAAAGFAGPPRRVVLPPGLGPVRPGFPTPGQPIMDILWHSTGAAGFACVPAPPVALLDFQGHRLPLRPPTGPRLIAPLGVNIELLPCAARLVRVAHLVSVHPDGAHVEHRTSDVSLAACLPPDAGRCPAVRESLAPIDRRSISARRLTRHRDDETPR